MFRGKKVKKNHPNYGFFQRVTEEYFTHEMPKYFSLPAGKKHGDFEVTFTWKNVEGKTIKRTYDTYGKLVYEND